MAGKLTAWEQALPRREPGSGSEDPKPTEPVSPSPPPGTVPDRPPLGGPGSGRDAWAAYIAALFQFDPADLEELSRDELVALEAGPPDHEG